MTARHDLVYLLSKMADETGAALGRVCSLLNACADRVDGETLAILAEDDDSYAESYAEPERHDA